MRLSTRALLVSLTVGLAVGIATGIGSSQAGTVISSEWVIVNGQRWALYKVIRAGKEEHLFRGSGGEILTLQEMAARFPAPAVDPELSAKIARLAPRAPGRAIVVLRNQPVEAVVGEGDRALARQTAAAQAPADALAPRARLGRGRV